MWAMLAELRDIDRDAVGAFAGWVTARAETHLPFVAEIDGYVVGAAWLLVAERVPGNESLDQWYGDVQSVMVREEYRNRGIGGGFNHHRRLLLWEPLGAPPGPFGAR